MCGISGFLSRTLELEPADVAWLAALDERLTTVEPGVAALPALRTILATLEARFSALMSAALCRRLVSDPSSRQLIDHLHRMLLRHEPVMLELSARGRTDVDPIIEGLRDYCWQLREEVLGHSARVMTLAGAASESPSAVNVAWAVEHVLAANDRLEVRGRDSAGITTQLVLNAHAFRSLETRWHASLHERRRDIHGGHRSIFLTEVDNHTIVVGFVYKTANLIGRLGDNGASLRRAIQADDLFWVLAKRTQGLAVLAHTRWASNGTISLSNCHPVNASNVGDGPHTPGLGAMFVLNGDIDNYRELLAEITDVSRAEIERSITTDAKAIPLAYRWTSPAARSSARFDERFRATMLKLEGAMAVAMIDPARPCEALLAQKGSGQGLYATALDDGWMFASEVYGLAAIGREVFNLSGGLPGGCISSLAPGVTSPQLSSIADGLPVSIIPEKIQIFARDIYRGRFRYFLEKEIHEAPQSIEKTLRGRYRRNGVGNARTVSFDDLPVDIWANLRRRARAGIRSVYVIGQGTAGVAATGIAHLISRALIGADESITPITGLRSSEFSAEVDALDLDGALVIAVSQSGTTTDTNRAVDLARARGAFVHAIINRRDSDLVRKADSVLYTSDGRDMEMSVASTKAFYSQIAAGKLTALFLADALRAMGEFELLQEMQELERLPDCVRDVLMLEKTIANCAAHHAPRARYWAVTGSGANHIAAMEIRIKLSELCYKSIPVDFTEDKKHIDLSTEPLTLVIANDLAPNVASDVVKEVAIFRAHNGRPVVFAAQGASAAAFAPYADQVIPIPSIGADLAFVLAAAAGHLFAFHAALVIDQGSQCLKRLMTRLTETMSGSEAEARLAIDGLDAFLSDAAEGVYDSSLGARHIARLASVGQNLRKAVQSGNFDGLVAVAGAAQVVVKEAIDEASRPIDTIRHQAKTVTVGTSRPEDTNSVRFRDARAIAEVA